MIFRKHEELIGESFPEKWSDNLNLNFSEYFSEKLKLSNTSFFSHGQLCADEIVMAMTVRDNANEKMATIILSRDLNKQEFEAPTKISKVKDQMVDILGVMVKEMLTDFEEISYGGRWNDYKYKKDNYFYKISREDISLLLETEKLLRKSH